MHTLGSYLRAHSAQIHPVIRHRRAFALKRSEPCRRGADLSREPSVGTEHVTLEEETWTASVELPARSKSSAGETT